MPRKAKGQPTSVPPGLPHGERKKHEESQSVAPLASQGDALQAAQAFKPKATPLSAPGDPNAPITSGMPMGAGPGPEAVQPPNLEQTANVDAFLAAPLLQTLGHIAAGKRMSPSTVRFMRMLRSELPVGYDARRLVNEEPSGT